MKMPEWPKTDDYKPAPCDPDSDRSTANYERARADAAMARLRYWDECARAILGRIAGVTVRTERDDLFNKLTVAECDLQIVLEHIGELPPA